MKTLFHSLYIILLLLTSISCKKEKEKVYPTYYMDQEFKDYVIFPIGTYWVYEEETSGEIDSVYLNRSIKEIDDSRRKFSYNYELITNNMRSSFYNDFIFGRGGAYLGDQQPCYYNEGYDSNIIVSIQFFSQSKINDSLRLSNNIATLYEAFYNSYTVKGKSYQMVKVFKALHNQVSNLPERTYYSRYIGVIRKELFNGQVWNLKRYHIAR